MILRVIVFDGNINITLLRWRCKSYMIIALYYKSKVSERFQYLIDILQTFFVRFHCFFPFCVLVFWLTITIQFDHQICVKHKYDRKWPLHISIALWQFELIELVGWCVLMQQEVILLTYIVSAAFCFVFRLFYACLYLLLKVHLILYLHLSAELQCFIYLIITSTYLYLEASLCCHIQGYE